MTGIEDSVAYTKTDEYVGNPETDTVFLLVKTAVKFKFSYQNMQEFKHFC